MKPLCASCSGIIGQPAATEPHDNLKTQSGHRLPHGWRESYVCHDCGAGLQRTTVDPGGSEGNEQGWSQFR